jgi:signal transduction histidine kinase
MQATSGQFRKRQDWRGFSALFIGLAAIALLAITMVILGNANENAVRWVEHTRKVINIAQRLLSSAEMINGGVRGFVATGDNQFLQAYNSDLPQLKGLAEELQKQTADNTAQQDTINKRLMPTLTEVETLSHELAKPHSANVTELLAQKRVMDQLRSAVAEIEQEENRLLKARSDQFLQITKTIWVVRFLLLATAIASIVIGVLGLRKMILREREQINSLEQANKALEIETAERRRAEEQANSASEAKTQFVASVSHEIRTPLSGVIGMAELLLDSPELTEDSRDLAARLYRASNQMLGVLNEILDFSKVEAGQMNVDAQEFDLRRVVDDVIGLSRFKAEEKGIVLGSEIDDDVPAKLTGDEAKIRQVLLNFTHNAIKFTHEGSVSVRVQREGDSYVRFRVKDTGIGLSQTSQQRLFKPYAQADKTTMRRFGGTGLGLSISKKYVELMNGELGLQSEAGKGTDIWFTIPMNLSS